MSNQSSLRYAASLQLHQLDQYVLEFGKCRTEAVSILQRLITAQTQRDHVTRLRIAASRRTPMLYTSGNNRALLQVDSRVSENKQILESVLDQMSTTSSKANELSFAITQDFGQIHTNPVLSTYSHQISSELFNYEYSELQKAAELIRQQALLMSSEIQVKLLQYRNCDAAQYKRLLTTWSSNVTAIDQDMNDLADLMLS